ncbi:MAG TPA: isoaspartyl peptidase/L-asparaginase [Polyangiaceae bacterium]|jgi:beta-aspartyl-peptidase (threonine type)
MTELDPDRVTASWGAEGGAWSILVHGGAGDVPAERVARHVEGCRAAALAGAEVLRAGGSALDAVERAVVMLEDDPSFNAGTGACLDEDGRIALDASIMEGSKLRAGAVCAMPPFLHPVSVARAVLDDGQHVLYAGEGAARFAVGRGFTPSTNEAMTTEIARARWEAARSKPGHDGWAGGTVGAVARDARGVVAAATSTGGRINKRAGRVGDSPVLGAGNYADDDGGACSLTGDGEAVLRLCLAKSAVDLMRAWTHPEEAARAAIRQMARRLGGTGGIILVDRDGRLGFARNTKTMTWAALGERLPETLGGA